MTTGQLVYHTKPKFFKAEDTVAFLKDLKERRGNNKIVVFWDNCSVHTATKVKEIAA